MNATNKYERRIENLKTLVDAEAKKAQDSLAALSEIIEKTFAESANTVTATEWNEDRADAHTKLVDLQWEMERLATSLEKALHAAVNVGTPDRSAAR